MEVLCKWEKQLLSRQEKVGVGKTTTTANIGTALAAMDKKVWWL